MDQVAFFRSCRCYTCFHLVLLVTTWLPVLVHRHKKMASRYRNDTRFPCSGGVRVHRISNHKLPVLQDKHSGKMYGFVNFETAQEAAHACAGMCSKEIDGYPLFVNRAQNKFGSERGPPLGSRPAGSAYKYNPSRVPHAYPPPSAPSSGVRSLNQPEGRQDPGPDKCEGIVAADNTREASVSPMPLPRVKTKVEQSDFGHMDNGNEATVFLKYLGKEVTEDDLQFAAEVCPLATLTWLCRHCMPLLSA
jgi:hypothetical protein